MTSLSSLPSHLTKVSLRKLRPDANTKGAHWENGELRFLGNARLKLLSIIGRWIHEGRISPVDRENTHHSGAAFKRPPQAGTLAGFVDLTQVSAMRFHLVRCRRQHYQVMRHEISTQIGVMVSCVN